MIEHTWGPWIIHDQSGCPVSDGVIVEVDIFVPPPLVGSGKHVTCVGVEWHGWDTVDMYSRQIQANMGITVGVIKYRIRKPRGMKLLDKIMNDIRKPVFA